jgi:hypothetical protein
MADWKEFSTAAWMDAVSAASRAVETELFLAADWAVNLVACSADLKVELKELLTDARMVAQWA